MTCDCPCHRGPGGHYHVAPCCYPEPFEFHIEITDEMVDNAARVIAGMSRKLWEELSLDNEPAIRYYQDQARAALKAALGQE